MSSKIENTTNKPFLGTWWLRMSLQRAETKFMIKISTKVKVQHIWRISTPRDPVKWISDITNFKEDNQYKMRGKKKSTNSTSQEPSPHFSKEPQRNLRDKLQSSEDNRMTMGWSASSRFMLTILKNHSFFMSTMDSCQSKLWMTLPVSSKSVREPSTDSWIKSKRRWKLLGLVHLITTVAEILLINYYNLILNGKLFKSQNNPNLFKRDH